MNYIVIDLEFNQPFDFPVGHKTILDPRCPFEIIQIGAVKMDQQFNITATYDFLIKPSIYFRIHPYVKKITGLEMELLDKHKIFPLVYEDFVKFIGTEQYVFCVWGGNDVKALFNNIAYHNLSRKRISPLYINVQPLASQKLNKPPGMSIGLKNAVESFNLEIDAPFHYALNDAIYTAKVFQIVRTENMVVQEFQWNNDPTAPEHYSFNPTLLYKVMEKDLGRKLTRKEKQIFKKVYFMGRSRQFDT